MNFQEHTMYKSREYFYNAAISVENISASFKLLSLPCFLSLYLIFLFFVGFFFSDLQMVQVQKMEKVNLINLQISLLSYQCLVWNWFIFEYYL